MFALGFFQACFCFQEGWVVLEIHAILAAYSVTDDLSICEPKCFSWLSFQLSINEGWGLFFRGVSEGRSPCVKSGTGHTVIFQPVLVFTVHIYWFSALLDLHWQLNSDMPSIVCPHAARKINISFMSLLGWWSHCVWVTNYPWLNVLQLVLGMFRYSVWY